MRDVDSARRLAPRRVRWPELISTSPALLIMIAALTLTTGCGDSETTTTHDVSRPAATLRQQAPIIMADDLGTLQSTSYTIQAGRIRGRTVELDVTVGGGCSSHRYQLYVSRDFMESYPVQTRAYLVHDSDDPCDALLRETLTFDIEPLLDEYRRAYGGRDDPIIVWLWERAEQDDRRLQLRYDP